MDDAVRGLLDNSQIYVRQARDSLSHLEYHACIERAAMSIEFSLKAALLLVRGRYPDREHDVSRALVEAFGEFPESFREKAARFALLSKITTLLSTFTRYGYEELSTPASRLFSRDEAETYLNSAQEVLSSCEQLFYKRGQT